MEKNKILMIVIIVLLVVLLSAIGFLAFSLAKFMKSGGSGSSAATSAVVEVLSPNDLKIVPLDKAISTNLKAGTDGVSHVASIGISIAVNNTDKKESPKMIESLTTNADVVKDICLSSIRSKTYEELNRQDGQDILRHEILERLKEEFHSNLIYTVYITDWYTE